MSPDFSNVSLVILFPFLGFLVQALFGKAIIDTLGTKIGRTVCGALAVLPIFASFLIGLGLTGQLANLGEESRSAIVTFFDWITLKSISIPFELRVDPLSMTMVLIITGIGSLIHLYAMGYMSDERDYARFFTYMNLFVTAMLILVLGNNLVLTFMGWEGVGLCSYLLIGFWYKDVANSKAANKAFIVNRIGDWGFTLGMFGIVVLMAANRGSLGITDSRWLSFDIILPYAHQILENHPAWATGIALLLFVGAMGKSAQYPLAIWLPDAMAGPTPVSALIHAATMVTSGIYLLTRMSEWFVASPLAMAVVAGVGALTALIGAITAFGQTDIKKVLAYSTVSQLGYMFIGCGVGAFYAGMFHVVTHAFFKALLFLGAGAVIHAMAHDQDMRNYGGLWKKVPITFWTMVAGWGAIAGIPWLFSGFWSKEAILGTAVNSENPYGFAGLTVGAWAGWVGFGVAFLTACYMTRMMILTFAGKEQRWRIAHAVEHAHDDHGHAHAADHHEDHAGHELSPIFFASTAEAEAEQLALQEDHHHHLDEHHEPHEVPPVMWMPLVVLAIFSLGWFGYLLYESPQFSLEHWLGFAHGHGEEGHHGPVSHTTLLLISAVTSLGGIALAFALYWKKLPEREGWDMAKWNPVQRFVGGRGIDITGFSLSVGNMLGSLSKAFDATIDFVVNGVGMVSKGLGGVGRLVQTGYVRAYALLMQIGVILLVGYVILTIMMRGMQ
ncbi:MAG: NADH-quinone oxidoreductase subunit L [Fimbriimonadaceae bacterium]|nr:NADH-quinone oxidoreductase subunit L [Fimbriimonadaceae bacterium]QYK56813.1 MAG: NADH-quinone oxidoreductase subunit L [Fimbriimonadaceae bacterium]